MGGNKKSVFDAPSIWHPGSWSTVSPSWIKMDLLASYADDTSDNQTLDVNEKVSSYTEHFFLCFILIVFTDSSKYFFKSFNTRIFGGFFFLVWLLAGYLLGEMRHF